MRQRDVMRSMQNTRRELADAVEAENDALRDDVAAGRLSVASSKQSVSQCEATTLPGVIPQPPPDWQTPLNGIISPSERGLITMQKQLEGTQNILMSSVDRVAHIDGQLMQLL